MNFAANQGSFNRHRPMESFQHQELTVLIDLLARYTSEYSKMFIGGTKQEEFETCKKMIKALQAEIEKRKNLPGHSPDPATHFNSSEELSS